MNGLGIDLDVSTVLAGVLVLGIFLYVVMDGFDLGMAMLFPVMHEDDRDVMVDTVAPVWDGNETWLVLGGGGLAQQPLGRLAAVVAD